MSVDGKVFGAVDYIVFVFVLAASLAVGVYHSLSKRTERTTAHFLMGGGKLQLVPVAVSMLVSVISAIGIIGLPAEVYTYGTMFFYYNFGMGVGCFIASFVFVPLLYPLRLTSAYEYLKKRFHSKAAESTGSIISIIQQVLYIGIACYAPSTALQVVTNIPEWATILTVSMVATVYTTMGGMKAVIWTDLLQSLVMLAGLLAVLIQSFTKVGSFDRVIEANKLWGRIQFEEVSVDPRIRNTVWSLFIGGTVQWCVRYGILQTSVQRYSALQDISKAKQCIWSLYLWPLACVFNETEEKYLRAIFWLIVYRSIYMNSFGVFAISTLSCLSGIAIFAYYAILHCDPLTSGKITNANQMLDHGVERKLVGEGQTPYQTETRPKRAAKLRLIIDLYSLKRLPEKVGQMLQVVAYFVMDTLDYPGLPGLLVASLFSAALSTVSSSLNGLAAITWETFLKGKFGHLPENKREHITRSLVALFGILGLSVAFICQQLKGPVSQVATSFDGVSGGPLLGIFLLGSLFPQANSKGCVVGAVIGLATLLWMSIGKLFTPPSVNNMQYPNCSYANVTDLDQPDYEMMHSERILSTGLHGFYEVSYLWYPVIGMFVTVIVGLFTSWITGFTDSADVDDKYLFSLTKWCKRSPRFSKSGDDPVELKSTIYKMPERNQLMGPEIKKDEKAGDIAF